MLDPWLTSTHPAVEALGSDLLQVYHQAAPPRRRALKTTDRENLETTLRTIAANLALASTMGAIPPTVGVLLRAAKQKLTRYDRRGLANLPAVLEILASAGILMVRTSSRKGVASAIVPGAGLAGALGRLQLQPGDFAQAPGREVIVLGRTERDHVDGTTAREVFDYTDTPETRRYRAEVERINRFLAAANLGMVDDGGPPVMTSARACRRTFNTPDGAERFDRGGRLFGGWWQDLPKVRRHAIRIEGETVADLDFSSMFLRLAYLEAGAVPPDGDLYGNVPGLSGARWRPGVKKVASAMFFRESPLARLPKGLEGLLPPGATGARVRAAILSAHPTLASVLERGLGLRLMFLEAQILVAALLRLTAAGVPALGMHDGLMVAASRESLARAAMAEASEEVVGFRLPVVHKPAPTAYGPPKGLAWGVGLEE